MWDRLLVDCNIASMDGRQGDPLGVVTNGAIAIEDGRILRVALTPVHGGDIAVDEQPVPHEAGFGRRRC